MGFVSESDANQELSAYSQDFKQNAWKMADKPVQERECTDVCCLVFFILCFGAFIGYSASSINSIVVEGDTEFVNDKDGDFLKGVDYQDIKTFAIIMFSCFGGAIAISLIFCLMLCVIPQMTIYIMAGSAIVAIIALAIFLAVQGHALGRFATYFFMLAFFYGIFICALR